ncbi:YfhO family protein [Candidatus Microgenomates bacterium]|nr:YfhO family protein [Candidatus Microgenomates bacterium]
MCKFVSYNSSVSLKEAVLAFLFFTSITLIFFHKIFFGLIPLPTDLIAGGYYPWLSYKWGFVTGVPVKNTNLSDAVSLFYPAKELAKELVKKGELPLWNPYMFGGYPLLASVSFGLLFPTMIFYLIFSSPVAWTLQTMSQPILALFFMYLFLRHLNLDKIPSLFGSIAFGFGGFLMLWMQWNTQATTALFLPILILLEDKYLISKKIKWGVLFSIFLALQIFAGYLPIISFTIVSLIIWYIFRSKGKSFFKLIFFIILSLLLSAVFLLPALELIQISQRTVETLPEGEGFTAVQNFITLVAPDFFGNDATGNFWGKGDHMDASLYVGVATLILAFLGIQKFFSKSTVKFAIGLLVVSIVISVSNPLSILLYKLGLWGGPSITMNRVNFMMNFSLSILGAYGLSAIKNYSKFSLKPIIVVLAIVLGIIIGLVIPREILLKSSELNSHLQRINISLRNMVLPSLLLGSVFSLIYLVKKWEPIRKVAAPIFILILTFELFRFGLKFNTFSPPSLLYPQTPITKFLQRYPNDRFIAQKDILPANMWVPFRLSSPEGYETIYPINTAKLLAVADSGNVDATPMTKWAILQNFNSKILDETNTRFLLTLKKEGMDKHPKYQKVFEDKEVEVWENTQSLPRVYLTRQVIKSSDRDTLKLLKDSNFPIREISITDDFEFKSLKELNSNLQYKPLTNSHIVIQATSNIDAYLVVLDSFYPGWKALIDGKEVTIHRTNYNFRGMILPKGTHIVEFIYAPKSLQLGAIISGASILLIILLLTYPKFINIKRFN